MEPEIGFLMANLARIGPGSRVLDPFTGCCSLLLSAAFLQRMTPMTPMTPISSSKSHNQLQRGQSDGPQGASAPGPVTSSSLPCCDSVDDKPHTSTRAEVKDTDKGCLVGVDACMGDDVSLIHSNFVAVGLGSALSSLTLHWDFAEKLLQVITEPYSQHNIFAIV